jgi:NDP-sugar pyrophosphorylase family protein
MDIKIENLFELTSYPFAAIFEGKTYPWEVIADLPSRAAHLVGSGAVINFPGVSIKGNVSIGQGSVVEPGVVIFGPTIIGKNCVVRSGAYVRGNVVIGDNVVIGHASEIKNSVILNGAQIPHFNYVGDSIIGNKAHLAAGAVIANTKLSGGNVVIKVETQNFDTGLKKFGAAVGDNTEVGAGAVLNPGSILGKSSIVYPLVSWRGVLPDNMIAKTQNTITPKK